jgi:predicted small lipoprotein YifL
MLKTKTTKILLAILILLPLAACGHRTPLDKPDDMVIDSASF